MAYRSGGLDDDLRRLEGVLATRESVLEQLRTVRLAHDELAAQVDGLGARLAALDEPGALATVMEWIGVSGDVRVEAERTRVELAERTRQLGELVVQERDLAEKLVAIDAAREEVARLTAARTAALRGPESPLGHDLRGLDVDLAASATRIAALDHVLGAADRSERALSDIRDIVAANTKARSVGHSVINVVAFLDNPAVPSSRELLRARLRAHLPFARSELEGFIGAFESLALPVDTTLRLVVTKIAEVTRAPVVEPPERSELAMQLDHVAAFVTRLVALVNDELTTVRRRHAAIAEQQRALVASRG